MLRKFTKDIGRYKQGATHDYPVSVWNKLAADAKVSLESFSEKIEFNPVHQSTHKGPVFERNARSGERVKLRPRTIN